MVSSVQQQGQNRQSFSAKDAVQCMAVGAVSGRLATDLVWRHTAKKYVNCIKEQTLGNLDNLSHAQKVSYSVANDVIDNTNYLTSLKNAILNPKETLSKVVEGAKNFKLSDFISKAKDGIGNTFKSLSSLKGSTFTETITNIGQKCGTIKGISIASTALFALAPLLGISIAQNIKKHGEQQAIGKDGKSVNVQA